MSAASDGLVFTILKVLSFVALAAMAGAIVYGAAMAAALLARYQCLRESADDPQAGPPIRHRRHVARDRRLHRHDDRQPPAVSETHQPGRVDAGSHRRQERVAQVQLHELPHAARRRRVLRPRPDQDRRAARPRLSRGVPEGPGRVLRRAEVSARHAQPESEQQGDQRRRVVLRVDLAHRHAGLAAAADPRFRRRDPRHAARHRDAGAERGGPRRGAAARGRSRQGAFGRTGRPRSGALQRAESRLLRLPLRKPRREPRGPDARRHRRARRCDSEGQRLQGERQRRGGLHPRIDHRSARLSRAGAHVLRRAGARSCPTITTRRSKRNRSINSSPTSQHSDRTTEETSCATALNPSPTGISHSRWCCSGSSSRSACLPRRSISAPIRC